MSENGKYRGLLFNESRGSLSLMWEEEEGYRYAGSYQVYEASMEDTRRRVNRIADSEYCEILLSPSGKYEVPEGQLLPLWRSIPVFPQEAVSEGASWRAFGERVLDPEASGLYTKVPVYCEYRYDGLSDTSLGLKHVITGMYAVRYKKSDGTSLDKNLVSVSGSHRLTIMIDADEGSSVFIRDLIDEEYRYVDGKSLKFSGFNLCWLGTRIGMNRQTVITEARDLLDREGIGDVDVTERSEGVVLSVKNLHFVPDQAVLLESEEDRLEALFEILQKIGPSRILVAGHTADVGTAESQIKLSEERARFICTELVSRGIAPGSIVYEGRGGTEPVGDNSTEEGRAANRRVEIIILEN